MFFHIAMKDLKTVFRDKKALAMILLMPILIILILGSALGSAFTQELGVEKFTLGVVNKDDGELSKIFIHQFLEKMPENFDVFVVDESKAEKMLKDKVAPSIIYIPENFTKNIGTNQNVDFKIKSVSDSEMKPLIVKGITEGYAKNLSLSYKGAKAGVDTLQKYNIPVSAPNMHTSAVTLMIMGELQRQLGSGMMEFKEMNQEKHKTVSAIQYYSAAMLVMFMLFGANLGSKLIVEEREGRTLSRIMSSGANKITLIGGKFAGLTVICFVQAMILIVFTRLAYGVNWGPLSAVLLVTLSLVLASAGFGMLIASIARTPKAADSIGAVLIQLFTILGGGMIPVYVMPQLMQDVSKVTLNFWATKAFSDLMLGAGLMSVLPYCGILAAMGVAYTGIGILKFKV